MTPASHTEHKGGMVDGIDLITQRRKAIAALRAKISVGRAQLDKDEAALAQEEQELAIAERVMGRLSAATPEAMMAPSAPKQPPRAMKGEGVPKYGTARPDRLPKMWQMIDAVLAAAEANGQKGLRGRDLVLGIGALYWPGVGANSIVPEVARMVHRGQLGKSGDLYVRITATEAFQTNRAAE